MRRVLEFLKWKAWWWKERQEQQEQQDDIGKDFREGLQSYAQTQGDIQLALATDFQRLWKAPLDEDDGEPAAQASAVELTVERDDDDEDDEDDEGDGWADDYEDEDM